MFNIYLFNVELHDVIEKLMYGVLKKNNVYRYILK